LGVINANMRQFRTKTAVCSDQCAKCTFEYIRIGLWFDYSKNRYAYNDLLFGYQKSGRKHEGSATFRLFSSEVEKVLNIADLKDHDSKQP
jgi:hypothetical protein